MAALGARGIGTLVHYPIPLHLQPAFASLGGRAGQLPVAEKAAAEVLSLPLYPELAEAQVREVARAVREAAGAGGGP
jgi:dTDP-4-amino-4,6-dideoxygalactose transaminase